MDNAFTKKKMEQAAHFALDAYFAENISNIESWFNIISPNGGTLQDLKNILETLKTKIGGIYYDSRKTCKYIKSELVHTS